MSSVSLVEGLESRFNFLEYDPTYKRAISPMMLSKRLAVGFPIEAAPVNGADGGAGIEG